MRNMEIIGKYKKLHEEWEVSEINFWHWCSKEYNKTNTKFFQSCLTFLILNLSHILHSIEDKGGKLFSGTLYYRTPFKFWKECNKLQVK